MARDIGKIARDYMTSEEQDGDRMLQSRLNH